MMMMSHIRNFHSIHCGHVLLQFLRMGIHIHIRNMDCIHCSSLNRHHVLHNNDSSRFHVRSCSSFRGNSHCLHSCCNSSNRIRHNNHHCHHSNHNRRSTNHLHMMMMSHIRNFHSIHCDHVLLQFLHMGIHIHIRNMDCIHCNSLNRHHVLHNNDSSRFHVRSCSSFRGSNHCLHSCCNSSNRIRRNNHHCHHSNHNRRSTNHLHMMMMSHIRNFHSIHCDHVLLQFLRMGIHIRI